MRIPLFFGGSSSARPDLRPPRIGNAFAFPTSLSRGNADVDDGVELLGSMLAVSLVRCVP
jgi:hypothetical protein